MNQDTGKVITALHYRPTGEICQRGGVEMDEAELGRFRTSQVAEKVLRSGLRAWSP